MLPKLVLIVSCLYVVQATLVVNAPADGDERIANAADTTQKVGSCGYAECNQFCRKLGFMRGVCIGTYCQCRNLRSRDVVMRPGIPNEDLETIEDNSVSFDEDAANSISDYDGPEPHNAINKEASDVPKANDVNAELITSDEVLEPAIPLAAVRRCSRGPCFTSCRRRGYSGGGICIGSVCRCRAFTSRQLNLHDNNAAEIALNESGDIISGNAPAEIVSISEGAAPQPLADCNSRSCDQTCRRIGFPGGACSNGRCKCDILRSAAPASALEYLSEEAAPEPLSDCNSRSCDQCDILRLAEPASAQEPLSEEAALQPLSDCNSRSCDQTCRRIGFPSGACSNGRCKCDILRSAEPASAQEPQEKGDPTHISDCNWVWCEQTCRRIGFPGGACSNGRCKCDILRSQRPPLIPVPGDD